MCVFHAHGTLLSWWIEIRPSTSDLWSCCGANWLWHTTCPRTRFHPGHLQQISLVPMIHPFSFNICIFFGPAGFSSNSKLDIFYTFLIYNPCLLVKLQMSNVHFTGISKPSILGGQRQLDRLGQGLRWDAFQGLQPCTGILRSVAGAALCIPLCQPSKSWSSWSCWSLDIRILMQYLYLCLSVCLSLYAFLSKGVGFFRAVK